MLYDLGVDVAEQPVRVTQIIQRLEKQFSLFMITEFLDESLEVLRNLLCWTFADVVYERLFVNSWQPEQLYLSDKAKANLEEYLKYDVEVYQYFRTKLFDMK
jgi:hypothetical protein